jgi:hypothetical protein
MLWQRSAKTQKSVQKAHKSAQKALFYDPTFERNINTINQLGRKSQYHPPFCDPRISRAVHRFFAQA